MRAREILVESSDCGHPPIGLSQEYKSCNAEVPCAADVDCAFAYWTKWSDCDNTCDGTKSRSRNIETQGHGDGDFCHGAETEISPCNIASETDACVKGPPVACKLAAWSAWDECDATCGSGQHRQTRTIENKAANGGDPCVGSLTQVKPCSSGACPGPPPPVDCAWGDWSDWGACTHCSGQKFRHRIVHHTNEKGGKPCKAGNSREIMACPRECHTSFYCHWADWAPWGSCDCTHGGKRGRQSRKRILDLTSTPPVHPSLLMQQIAELKDSDKLAELQRTQDMVVAFAVGALSLIAVLGSVRIFRAARGDSGSGALRNPADPYSLGIDTGDDSSSSRHFFFRDSAPQRIEAGEATRNHLLVE